MTGLIGCSFRSLLIVVAEIATIAIVVVEAPSEWRPVPVKSRLLGLFGNTRRVWHDGERISRVYVTVKNSKR